MIITKTPLRISFFGGGTDYPAWVKEHGGAVLSTSIDKYSYLHVLRLPPFFPHRIKVVWSHIEEVNAVDEILHPSVRETLRFTRFKDGISVNYNGDLPARTGLGSSSSFTVGFLHAIYGLQNARIADKKSLAERAIHIEQKLIRENVGSQDQVASACGGFNKIEFHRDGSFTVIPVKLRRGRLEVLQDHMLLFFTGISRTASDIAETQVRTMHEKSRELHAMRAMVDRALEILGSRGDWPKEFGGLLHESWLLKRSLTPKISTGDIDGHYARALEAGAYGGKLLGAGGGGFMLIFAPPKKHAAVKKALKKLLHVPFKFESEGTSILYKYGS